ncbi:hypothetical protein V1511DRAFT_492086 [Dipodascopsis uninucleata]
MPVGYSVLRASRVSAARSALNMMKYSTKAETPSSKMKKLKEIPAELYPLFFTLGCGILAAAVALSRKLLYDPAVRVARSNEK